MRKVGGPCRCREGICSEHFGRSGVPESEWEENKRKKPHPKPQSISAKKRKWVKTGWMPKELNPFENRKYWNGFEYWKVGVTKRKGQGQDWHDLEYPPRKVRITVEEL